MDKRGAYRSSFRSFAKRCLFYSLALTVGILNPHLSFWLPLLVCYCRDWPFSITIFRGGQNVDLVFSFTSEILVYQPIFWTWVIMALLSLASFVFNAELEKNPERCPTLPGSGH